MADLGTLRATGDPLADATVEELAASHVSPRMRWPELVQLATARPLQFPRLRALVDHVATEPSWLDRRRLRHGQRLFERHALEATVVFTLDSLVQTYLVPEIAVVLAHTGLLTNQVERRLAETAKMVLDVIGPGALERGGYGVASVLRVRLLHARVRRAIATHRPVSWAPGKVPIDQAELLLTLHAHGWVIVRGLRRLGVDPRPDEVDGYQHLWRYVGRLMGIAETSLPTSVEGASRSYDHLCAQMFAPSDASRTLTAALHDASALQPPLFLPRPMIVQLTRYLLGAPMADALDLPTHHGVQRALRRFARTRARVPTALPRFVPPRPHSGGAAPWSAPPAGRVARRLGGAYFGWMIRRSHRRTGIPFESPR